MAFLEPEYDNGLFETGNGGTEMLTRETPITIRTHVPDSADFGTTEETTWGAFEDANDPATVADARAQIEVDNYAELGGGAAPIVWVFA